VANPPVVPFFPLLMKDLAFMHEGNRTRIEGLINFDKLRMMAQELRQIELLRHTRYVACMHALMLHRRMYA